MSKLTAKQELFCQEYLIDLNATQAAIRAGYSKDTSGEMGYENLNKPQIQTYISELKAIRAKRCEISQDNVLNELAKIAFADIRDYYNEAGSLKKPHELSDQAAASLSGLEIDELMVYNEDKGVKETVGECKKIKLHDKLRALEGLGKHLGLFEKDNRQKTPDMPAVIGWNITNTSESEK